MEDEIFIIVVVAIISGTVMITTLIRSVVIAATRKNKPAKGESSLSMRELEALLRTVVEESTAPLAHRLEALEERLDTRLLDAPPKEDAALHEAFGAEERAPIPRS